MKNVWLLLTALFVFGVSACKKDVETDPEEPIEEAPKVVNGEFSADAIKVYEGTSVKFSVNDAQNITSYQWSFEGGTPATSTAASPEVVFDTFGKYQVTLKVNSENDEDEVNKPNFLTVVPGKGLVSYYNFNGNADDMMGIADGTVEGATMSKDRNGVDDSAYAFDGDDYINLGVVDEFKFDSTFTINAWFYRTGGVGQTILINNETRYEIAPEVNGRIFYAVNNDDPGWKWRNVEAGNQDSTWHFLTFQYDMNAVNIYLDGTLKASTPASGLLKGTDKFFKTYIGGRESTNQRFIGMIDDVSIYSTVLDPAAIQFIYEEGLE
ncbi:MAG: LamG-like jellyroll fold domain-containing protein [Bacteroidota bacterium]